MPLYIARCYLKLGDYGRALEFARQCLQLENELISVRTGIKSDVSLVLSEIYEQLGNQQRAFEYLKMHQNIRYESDRLDEANRVADAEIRAIIEKSQEEIDQLERDSIQTAQENRIQRLWIFSISGALVSLIIVSIILYRNNQHKQKANTLLKEQKEKIQVTLEKLESTQSQLIQSEKMASLGELTAGIAHEIQNPLNFVNNFSEVNVELLHELNAGPLTKLPETAKEEADEIIAHLVQNLEKVSFHGKRADSIVKSMLLHSRSSVGTKELTNINVLADEYLRLSFHGMRARDKSFNAKYNLDIEEDLPEIRVISQEIGRVMLNMINNAFYAVLKKSREGIHGYTPEVRVSIRKLNGRIEIRIKDNGCGIPANIRDKIFQPFFTTKPAGEGTGLGLSISYDIITKGHGGDMKVVSHTAENEAHQETGTEFIINLPI
ncbi:MAG: hypothetical protein KFF73_06840 [Cyclobacteriaceae bacterium]|nr:hypothetical protein [Cyclobacteriaceae bacterium]